MAPVYRSGGFMRMHSTDLLGELWGLARRHAPSVRDATRHLGTSPSQADVDLACGELRRIYLGARIEIDALAAHSSFDRSHLIRNGIATSHGSNLVFWFGLLELDELESPAWSGIAPAIAGSADTRGWWVKGLAAVRAVLRGSSSFSPQAILEIGDDVQGPALLAALTTPRRRGRLHPKAFLNAVRRVESQELIAAVRQRRRSFPALELSRAQFHSMPSVVRRFFLSTRGTRAWILSNQAQAAFERKPLSFPESPQSLRARQRVAATRVLAAVRRRNWSAFSAEDLTWASEHPSWVPRLDTALRRPIKRITHAQQWSCEEPCVDANALSSPAREILALYVSARVPSVETIAMMRDDDLGSAMAWMTYDAGAAAKNLLHRVPPERRPAIVRNMLQRDAEDVVELWKVVGASLGSRLVTEAVSHREDVRLLLAELFRNKGSEHAQVRGALLPQLITTQGVSQWAVEIVMKRDPSGRTLALLLRGVGAEPTLGAVLDQAASRAAAANPFSPLGRVVARAFRDTLRKGEIEAVWEGLSHRYVGDLYRGLSRSLRIDIESAVPTLVARIYRLPSGARDLLEASIRQPAMGFYLDDHLSPSHRSRMIPWVRKRWEGAPGVTAAMEIAALACASDSRFLISLAKLLAADTERTAGTGLDHMYRTYPLPKKRGGNRIITVPGLPLRRLQRRLARVLLANVPNHEAAHGFRAGRSIVTNAQPHVGQAMVVNVDIRSFFPSTAHGRILGAWHGASGHVLSQRALHLLSDISSYGGGLPIGAPTSPALANLILRPADRALSKAAARFGIQYTRYADDLTFSGDTDTHRIIPFVERVLGGLGYEIEEAKTNIFRRGRRQIVTGLVVNDRVNVPRRLRRRIRAATHARSIGRQPYWHDRPMSDSELLGRIAALGAVRPEEAAELRAQIRKREA